MVGVGGNEGLYDQLRPCSEPKRLVYFASVPSLLFEVLVL